MTVNVSRRGFLAFLTAASVAAVLPNASPAQAFDLPTLEIGDKFMIELMADRKHVRIRREDGRRIADVPAELVKLLPNEYGRQPDIWECPVTLTLVED